MSVRKYNKYLEMDDYYEFLATNDESVKFIIDKDDFEKIKEISWYVNKKTKNGYYMEHKGRESISVHRLIMGAKKGEYVDHINGDTLDNRKNNLRIVTNQQNGFNSNIKANNTSGFIGVYYDKNRFKWVASIKLNYKTIHLGRFKLINEAIISRLKAELKYFGRDFAPQRDLFEEYGIGCDFNEK